jgi:hypothetical protein
VLAAVLLLYGATRYTDEETLMTQLVIDPRSAFSNLAMSEVLGRIGGMDLLAQPLADLRSQVSAVVRAASAERAFERAEAELAGQVAVIAEVGRLTRRSSSTRSARWLAGRRTRSATSG